MIERIVGKAAAVLPAIVGSVFPIVLRFLGKDVWFVAKHV